MSKERIYKMDDGSWLTSDKKEGVGRDKMNFDAPSWNCLLYTSPSPRDA